MFRWLGMRLYAFVSARDPHTNVYGVARTLLALGTFGVLLCSNPLTVFRPGLGALEEPICSGLRGASLFCVLGRDHLVEARVLALAALVPVVIGWRPRYTGVVHWYVSASLMLSGVLIDGGDQVAAILALLLIPVTLTDPRPWHWSAPASAHARGRVGGATDLGPLPVSTAAVRIVAFAAFYVIRLQVAGIYFQAAVSKMRVEEWRDGTAVYYWFTDPWFGLSEPLRSYVLPLVVSGVGVVILTWGALAIETVLFASLFMERRFRPLVLWVGVLFHALIAVAHGLLSFAFSMWGALVLLLRPPEQEFARLRIAWSRRFNYARLRTTTDPDPGVRPTAARGAI